MQASCCDHNCDLEDGKKDSCTPLMHLLSKSKMLWLRSCSTQRPTKYLYTAINQAVPQNGTVNDSIMCRPTGLWVDAICWVHGLTRSRTKTTSGTNVTSKIKTSMCLLLLTFNHHPPLTTKTQLNGVLAAIKSRCSGATQATFNTLFLLLNRAHASSPPQPTLPREVSQANFLLLSNPYTSCATATK